MTPSDFYVLAHPVTEPRVLRCSALELQGIVHAFGTRGDSDLPVAHVSGAPRAASHPPREQHGASRLAQRVGLPETRFFMVRQVHGATVTVVHAGSTPQQLRQHEADALITDVPGMALAVRTADCAPVLIADAVSGVVAAAHAGWRGARAGIIERTVECMRTEFRCEASRMVAAVGPAIGVDAYEVGEEVAAAFRGLKGAVREARSAAGRPHLDLARAVRELLLGAGVGHVSVSSICTHSQPDLFWSFRRDGVAAGRQMSVIGLTAASPMSRDHARSLAEG